MSASARSVSIWEVETVIAHGRVARIGTGTSARWSATVLEELLDVKYWLALLREAYRLEVPINDTDLPAGGTLVDETRAVLKDRGITLDRLAVADLGLRRLGSSPVPPATVDRFVRLLETLNALLPP